MSKKQVLLFVGQDITAHLIMNRVVKDMLDHGVYEPVIILPKNASSPRANLPQLKEFSFFEKTLLNDTVYPFIHETPSQCAKNLSPQQFQDQFEVPVQLIDDVNDPAFVESVRANPDVACALSIRCTQIFHKPIFDAIRSHNAMFLNLHSGLLPDYRGVMPTMRRMYDIATGKADGTDYGCTLHRVDPFDPDVKDKGIDTGKIITVKSIELNPNHSGYQAYVGMVDVGAEALITALSDIHKGNTLRGYPQSDLGSAYYTFPTADEMTQWENAGIVLVRETEVIDTLVSAFSKASANHGKRLTAALTDSINKWRELNPPAVAVESRAVMHRANTTPHQQGLGFIPVFRAA
jgi:methionyl-tRNA formyltransferase